MGETAIDDTAAITRLVRFLAVPGITGQEAAIAHQKDTAAKSTAERRCHAKRRSAAEQSRSDLTAPGRCGRAE